MKAEHLAVLLNSVSSEFRDGLLWFDEQTGKDIPWPAPSAVPSLSFLVSQAKAIYKPKDSNINGVALSIRQNLDSPYANKAPIFRDDGTWVYAYHQEGASFDSSFTNKALFENIKHRSPVAVLIQSKSKPNPLYLVLGLAIVTHYENNFFYLEGFNSEGFSHQSPLESLLDAVESEEDPLSDDALDPDYDARTRVLATIVRRRGQKAFRQSLLSAYEGKCAITGSQVEAVLEAAHIVPYRGDSSNKITNGLLLRADIHTLFDLGLMAIDPSTRTVIVTPSLNGTEYGDFVGAHIFEPSDSALRPSDKALQSQLDYFNNLSKNLK
jgi:hypothetical protein